MIQNKTIGDDDGDDDDDDDDDHGDDGVCVSQS